jgi:hypothetical protein
MIAQVIVMAFDQTAGPILLATSLAQMFIAIYNHKTAAMNKNIFVFHPRKKNTHVIIIKTIIASISYLKFALFVNQDFIFKLIN